MVLFGTYNHTLDKKGQLIIPSKSREHFKYNKIFISLGFDGCINISNEVELNKLILKINSIKSDSLYKKSFRL